MLGRVAIMLAAAAFGGAAAAQTPEQAMPQLAPVIVPQPGPEAEALALELARTGTLAGLLPLVAAKETEEMLAAHPDLTPAERERFRIVAQTTYAAGRDKLFAATAREYARRLTLAELRQLAAIARHPASARLRQVQPAAILGTMQAMGGMDFKGDTLAAFCRESGKGCAKK